MNKNESTVQKFLNLSIEKKRLVWYFLRAAQENPALYEIVREVLALDTDGFDTFCKAIEIPCAIDGALAR